MAKKDRLNKALSAKKIEAEVDRIMKGIPALDVELHDAPTTPSKPASSGIVVVRDYVTYSAYEDPIEG